MQHPILYTVEQAATILQISERTMYRVIKSGDIETITIRGSRRIRQTSLERYINNLQRVSREREVKFS